MADLLRLLRTTENEVIILRPVVFLTEAAQLRCQIVADYKQMADIVDAAEQIDIEIQVTSSEYWVERTLFYLGKMFVDQLKPGEDYQKLEKCIHIGILNFTMFEDEEYYSCFHFWSDQGRKMYSDKVEIHTLELPKLAKYEYPETELLKWLQFINAETKEEFEMAAEKSEYIKKAYEDLNRISADEEKRLEYEARERAIRDHQYFSTVYKETGLREGRKEGLKIGRQEGLQEGRQEGRQEGIQAVVELLQEMGMEKEIVCVKIQERFQFSLSDAAKEVEKYWKS